MHRVVAVISSALALAACSTSSMNLDVFRPAPLVDSVRFESEPPGAVAKSSNGQTCVTPCALALPTETPLTATFTLNGYAPVTENLEIVQDTAAPPRFRPNPVIVELPIAAPPKPAKTKAPKKRVPPSAPHAKPAAKSAAPRTSAAPAPASPTMAAPPEQQILAPWPDEPVPQR
jgi:hypothetical protein